MPSTILPGPSRNLRLGVKYNVITDFPHLGLHSASASGDIGLVQYAISHGQPVNSVLDGVLPIHAACAGGNVFVVNFLIENGADVNAPRLPRRYSDRSRDAAAPIVGTSGSTPLHFAAANGHLNVVRILLSHGAAPDRSDKHGITPEIIARQNGWIECAEVLARAISTVKGGTSFPLDNLEALRKRLHFKCSSDQIHSAGATSDAESRAPQSDQESRPLYSGSGESPSQLSTQTVAPLPSGRRPSLPQVFDDSSIKPPSHSNRSTRPRSAGTGSESRKLHSKLSLLTLFKKSNADSSSSSVASVSDAHVPSPPPSQPIPLTGSPAHLPNALPVSPRSIPVPPSFSSRDPSHLESQRRKLESSASLTNVRAYPLHPADIHSAITRERSRNRSVSGASTVSLVDDETGSADGVPFRSGILRMHNRSISGHGSASQPSSLPRTIRFERSASESTSFAGGTRSPGARGQLENRMRLHGITSCEDDYDRIPDTIEESPVISYAAPPVFINVISDNDDDLDEEYGIPLRDPELHAAKDRSAANALLPFSINVPPPIDDVLTESRLRGDSISSSGTTATTSTYPRTSSSDAAGSMAASSVTPHPLGSPPMVPASVELEVDAEEAREPRQRPRKIPAPLDIDISTISSPAEAEELVQRTQQSILNLEQYLDQHVKKDSGTGRTPLSAKLAAYGESLAIERRLKEQAQASPEHDPRINGRPSLLSATKPSSTYPMSNSGNSDSSSESTSQEAPFEHVGQTTWPASYDEPRGFPSSPPGDLMYSPPRSRTPDLDPEPTLTGVPLSRVSTAPSYGSTSARRGRQRDPSRSVQKLTRMGFSTFDKWHASPLKARASRSPPPSLRFGLRTIMQSFQGK